MRKICVLTFVTLDGVMQAPGGPDEDTSEGFRHGGWLVGYFDEHVGREMGKQMGRAFDLLLGRRTYEIFASHWPHSTDPGADLINKARKYVATHRPLATDWSGTASRLRSDVAGALRELRQESGPELQVHGSSGLIQTLLANDLVDELRLKIFPVTVGSGKKLFAEGTRPAGFELLESSVSPSGVIVASYGRAGEVKSGSLPTPP
jgi:dihydrofolate reductase